MVDVTGGTREREPQASTGTDPWIHLRVPDYCSACDEQLFMCGCIDVNLTDNRRGSAHDNKTVAQQQGEPTQTRLTTQHQEELTDEVATAQREETTREDVEDENLCSTPRQTRVNEERRFEAHGEGRQQVYGARRQDNCFPMGSTN